jgi:hypothetical protein
MAQTGKKEKSFRIAVFIEIIVNNKEKERELSVGHLHHKQARYQLSCHCRHGTACFNKALINS